MPAVTIRLPDSLLQEIDAWAWVDGLASGRGNGRSEAVRAALEQYAAIRAGLASLSPTEKARFAKTIDSIRRSSDSARKLAEAMDALLQE
jgi:Arc/MetJ-type ribon-helix-helix transcriptional regulator